MKKTILLFTLILYLIYYKLYRNEELYTNCDNILNKSLDKSKILILAEQFWYEDKKDDIVESNILLTLLENMKEYEVIIFNNPSKFYNYLKKSEKNKIKYIFLFQDILSDSWITGVTLDNMYKYLINLRDRNNIVFYPGIENTDLFASKKYYKILKDNMYYSVLPHTEIIEVKNFTENDFLFIVKKFKFICDKLLKKFNKIVIKKGYSYSSIQIQFLDKNIVNDKKEFINSILKLEKKKSFGIQDHALPWEHGINRTYIIQGYNEIINKNNLGEYRIFFIDGVPMYMSWGDDYPNICIDDLLKSNTLDYKMNNNDNTVEGLLNTDLEELQYISNNIDLEIARNIIDFASVVYKDFIKMFWKNQMKHPIVFRLDISWAEEKHFLDKHSIYLKNSKKWIRLYINELEIDPTHFLYNNFLCKNNKLINSKHIQILIYKIIVKFIKLNKQLLK